MNQTKDTARPPVVPSESVPRVGPVRSVPAAVLASLVWTVVLGVQLLLEPKVEEYFSDIGVALPGVSLMAINSARWLQGHAPGTTFPMWPAAMLVLAMVIGVLSVIGSSRRGPRTMLWLVFALGVLVLLLLAVGYGLPLLAVQQSLAANGAAGTP